MFTNNPYPKFYIFDTQKNLPMRREILYGLEYFFQALHEVFGLLHGE